MSQQTIKQQARRTAREMADKRRREREERERRVVDLAEQVMVAIGQRDAAVAETEKRAGDALRELTEVEGLSLRLPLGGRARGSGCRFGGLMTPASRRSRRRSLILRCSRGTGRRSPRCRAVSACGGPGPSRVGPSGSAPRAVVMAGSGTRRVG